MKDHFSFEQLDRRMLSTMTEIRQIRRKILVEMIVTTAFIFFAVKFMSGPRMFGFILPPLILNGFAWFLWINSRFRQAIGRFRPFADERFEFEPDNLVDEYRASRFYLRRLIRTEAIFDILTGFQFLFVVIGFVVTFFFSF